MFLSEIKIMNENIWVDGYRKQKEIILCGDAMLARSHFMKLQPLHVVQIFLKHFSCAGGG